MTFKNALLILTFAGVAIGMAVLSVTPPFVTPLWPMIVLGLCGIAILGIRDRFPRLSFACSIVLAVLSMAVGSGAEVVLALIAVYTLGVRWSGSVIWIGFGAALAGGAVGAWALSLRGNIAPPILGLAPPVLARDTWTDWGNTYLIIAAILLIVTLLGTNVGHRRRHIRELVERADRLASERDQQAQTARILERERISREMHDVIAHSLSVIIAISDGAFATVDNQPAEAKEAIGRVAATGRKTLGEVRRLLGSVLADQSLDAAEHEPQPDASQLASLVAEFVTAGLPVKLVVTGTATSDAALGLTVYRIVQESLTNILRHARSVQSATVNVTWSDEEVTILVLNTGARVTDPTGLGRGILGMRERVALYKGVIEAGPQEGGGWRVLAHLEGGASDNG